MSDAGEGSGMSTRPPANLSPREGWQRYLERRRTETTDRSMKTYKYRIKLFVEWCEDQGLERVEQLTGWTIEEYETHRSAQDIAPVTLKGEMGTIKNWIEYLERLEVVDEGLHEKIHVPAISRSEQSSDTQLAPVNAIELLKAFRETPSLYGTRKHALLELLWFTGARMGGIKALDLQDFYPGEKFVEFVHRPSSDTPLKNNLDGQRPVGIPRDVSDILDYYVENRRTEKWDEYDREPLFTTRVGRISTNTIRSDCYMATFPCNRAPCPHGKDPESCDYTARNDSSKCPSSRSPHQVRTGSIRWQLDIGLPPSVVSERVNASLDVIKTHYDKATPLERMEARRRRFVDSMDLTLEPVS